MRKKAADGKSPINNFARRNQNRFGFSSQSDDDKQKKRGANKQRRQTLVRSPQTADAAFGVSDDGFRKIGGQFDFVADYDRGSIACNAGRVRARRTQSWVQRRNLQSRVSSVHVVERLYNSVE